MNIDNIGNALPDNNIKSDLRAKHKMLVRSVITSGDDYMVIFNTMAQLNNADDIFGGLVNDYCDRLKYLVINQVELKKWLYR